MNHNNNPNIPPLPKSSSGRRTTRLRGQTYPRPFDNNNNVNNNKHANINNTPTSSSNINNNNMSSSTKKNNNNNKTATKNKYNKFTSPKRKRSESSVSHEERVRSAIRSSGYKHLNMNIDLRGSFDDLSLSNKGDLSPMSILNSEPPRSSRRVEIDGESPPFSARSDISNNSSNNDSSGSSFFAQSPNATISPQQQMSSTKSSSGIMSISSIPGINNDPLNILSGGRKRNNSSSRRRFRDSLFEQHINKSNSHKKNLTFTLRVEGIAAMPSKSKSARGYSTTNNNFNSNNNNSHHSSSKGPIRASKSSSMKKRSNRKYKYNNNGTNQEMFRSPRPVPPKIPTSTNKKNRDNNDNTMATDDDLHGLMNITPNYEQKKNDMSISSNGSLSGSLSARSLSSNSSIHSIRSVNSSTEKAFHYGDIMMDEDEFGTFNNNNNHGVPPLPFHTPSKPVWRGPSPREDDDDEDEFKMSSLKKKSGLHINDLNDSVGSLGDDDLKPNSDNNVLYSSKVADVEDLNQSQDSFDGNNNNNNNNNMENNHLNNSFDSDHGYGTNNNNDVKDGNNLKASNNNNKVTPTGRPTPDMEAFDRKKSTPVREKGPQCPPTPVRTPSWQHNSSVGPGSPGGIERRNSLDGTKVLFAENDSFNSDVVAFDVDFENLGQLGSGAFSKVFKCRSVHDQKLYAIKKSRRPFRSKRDRARYLEEVETFQLLGPKCPHVLHYHKAWQEHGYFYIQSEYCARGNLKVFFDEIDESVMVPDIAIWGIIVDICAGLSHIHTHNLVHLDIKPQNIFITNDGTLKIGDFGMVREVGSSEDGHEGDNRYMAPELLDSSLKSPAADMFSFGIMMWEIMFNEPPPHDGEEWHNFRSDRVPRPNKSRSDELFSLICKFLSADPSKRPTSRQVLTIPRVQAAMQETNSFITSVPRKKKRPRFPHLQLGRSDSFVGSNAGFDPNEIARMREGLCTPKDQPVNRDW